MKILLVTPRFFPESFSITNIAKELKHRGHDITVITGRPNSGKWMIYEGYQNIKEEIIDGIKVIRLNEIPRKKGFFGLLVNYISIYKVYGKFFRKFEERFDIVFSHVLSPIFAIKNVGLYCKKKKLPHFLYGLDIWPESLVAANYCKRNSILYRYMKRMCISIYNSCDMIAYSSPCVESYLKDDLRLNVNFKHVYQPCLTNVPSDELLCHDFKKNGKMKILFCGTIARFNRLDIMLKALAHCKYKDKIVFDIVGSGSEMHKLEKMVKRFNLTNMVVFHGRVPSEETISYFVNSDALFVPLFYNCKTSEMIPQKLIEYFMYKKPILGMIKGDGADLLKKASLLNVISDQTVESLANGLDKLFCYSNSKLEKCSLDNRLFFMNEKRFLLSNIVNELELLLNETIKIYNEKK